MSGEEWKLPEPGEPFGYGRRRCCEEDYGGSHYHCPACGRVSSMYGCVSGEPSRRRCTGQELPDSHGNLLAITGPFDGPPPWCAMTGGDADPAT